MEINPELVTAELIKELSIVESATLVATIIVTLIAWLVVTFLSGKEVKNEVNCN